MPFLDNFKPIEVTVEDQKDYTLSVQLGDGIMNGSSSFFNFKNERISGNPIINSPLGKGKDIRGKQIRVLSSFEADNSAATFVSVIYDINTQQEERKAPKGDHTFFTFDVDIKFK